MQWSLNSRGKRYLKRPEPFQPPRTYGSVLKHSNFYFKILRSVFFLPNEIKTQNTGASQLPQTAPPASWSDFMQQRLEYLFSFQRAYGLIFKSSATHHQGQPSRKAWCTAAPPVTHGTFWKSSSPKLGIWSPWKSCPCLGELNSRKASCLVQKCNPSTQKAKKTLNQRRKKKKAEKYNKTEKEKKERQERVE